jgi:hypothetical protein
MPIVVHDDFSGVSARLLRVNLTAADAERLINGVGLFESRINIG